MDGDFTKALRLLKKVQGDLQRALVLLEKVSKKQLTNNAQKTSTKAAQLPEDPEFWQEKWKGLEAAFEEQGTPAVEAFVNDNTREFLLRFLRHNHIPLPGRSKCSKQQIAKELIQRLREQRALKRGAFTRSPRHLRNKEG
jgi:DNA segregation ATPase FtsK/SpoIIIE-like protein